ncbi:MAG: hypothetical protein PSX80_04765 [bacterium]|nr:hypothetical protein [bacterium]
MNRPLVYRDDYFNTTLRGDGDDTMGLAPLVIPLISAAPQIFQSILGLFGGGRKAQFQGLAEINTAGQQATQAMDQIKAALASGQMSPGQAVSEAQKIVQSFNDPKIVYPASKGQDAAARTQFIAALNSALQQIQALAAAAPTKASGAAGDVLGGISTNTLLVVGGGLLAVLMLKK